MVIFNSYVKLPEGKSIELLILPSGKHTKSDIENGPVEIVDVPSYKMVFFHSYVNVYQRVIVIILILIRTDEMIRTRN